MTYHLKLGAILLGWSTVCFCPEGFAQIVPDGTLPSNSIVESQTDLARISGGTAVGNNLFHSFERFNVSTGTTAYFDNALPIENIITRVTGGQLSTIDGVIRANGTANLFVLNPNGIVFGPNARLAIGGSFLASTADRFVFADGSTFSATAPTQTPPLLSIAVPIGLQWNDGTPGNILVRGLGHTLPDKNPLVVPIAERNSGMGLRVVPGSTLALVGGDVTLDGGLLSTPQGRIELGSVGAGTVSLNADGAALSLGYAEAGNFGTVRLQSKAAADVSGVGGGSVQVRGQTVSLADDSRILAETLGSENGANIAIDTDRLTLTSDSFVSTSTYGDGKGGNLEVNARSIEAVGSSELQDFLPIYLNTILENPAQIGSGLYATGFGAGDAGTLTVKTDTLSLRQSAFFSVLTAGTGRGGILTVNAADTVEIDGAQITVDSLGNGDGGVLNIEARTITMKGGAGIYGSSLGTGRGGIVNLRASESIEIGGSTPNGVYDSGLGSNAFSSGSGGFVSVRAPRISLRDGGVVSGGVGPQSSGRGATLIISASESLELSGASSTGSTLTRIDTQSKGSGPAGDIEITAGRLSIRDGATISTSTLGSGAAGRLTVRADRIEISGTSPDGQFRSNLSSEADLKAIPPSPVFPPNGANVLGAAGDLTVIADTLIVSDRGRLAVSSQGQGESAGNMTLQTRSLLLEGLATITAEPSTGTGGNISISANDIQLRDRSGITTNASGNSRGGNIAIATDTLVALGNSDITANAQTGFGGQVSIKADGIFGTQLRDAPTPQSDITATSTLGAAFSGTVTLQTPDVDAGAGLVQLPENPIDDADKVVSGCGNTQENQFAVSGRGGFPEDPTSAIAAGTVWEDWQELPEVPETGNRLRLPTPQPTLPVEATDWLVNDAGHVELVARVPHSGSGGAWDERSSCEYRQSPSN